MPSVDPQPPPPVPTEDFSTFRYGGAFFPLPSGEGAPVPEWCEGSALLRDADPARFHAIAFFAWALNQFVGQRLASAGVAAGVKVGTQAVAAVATVDPEPFANGADLSLERFPLLAVYRKRGPARDITTTYSYREGRWDVRYVLPAMGYGAAKKVSPVLHAVEQTIDWCCEQSAHPQFVPYGGKRGDDVWRAAGIMEISSGDSAWEYMPASAGSNVYLAVRVEVTCKERRMPLLPGDPGYPALFDGRVDATITTPASSDDASTPIVVEVATDVPPPKSGA